MIVLKGLHKSFFGKNHSSDLVLREIDLEIADGEFVAIVGPGGNGKSTLLKILAGLEKATSGEVWVDDQMIESPDPKRGIIFQETALYPWMTVIENTMFGPLSRSVSEKEARKRAEEWLNFFGLKKFLNKYPYELSGGMQQRVEIARVIVNDPDIILCDEPFGGLDWITREILCDEFLRLWHQTRKTVLYVTHALEEAVYMSQKVCILTSKPATVSEVIPIKLPDKRWAEKGLRFSEEFAQYVEKIRGCVHAEAMKGSGMR
jgi:NitT/TauT family transport system ATP-binding protein